MCMSQVCRASPLKKYVIYDSKEPIPAMEPAPIVVPDPVGGRVGDGVSIKK